jgi:cysteine-rich repeat protein
MKRVYMLTVICLFFLLMFRVSAEALVAPGNLEAVAVSPGQVNLIWIDVNPVKAGVFGYSIERSLTATGGFVVVGASRKKIMSYTDKGLEQAMTYYYRVRAVGKKGAFSPYSSPAKVTTSGVDTTSPTVSIVTPPAGTTYSAAQTVPITASVSDNVGVSKVEFYDNGAMAGAVVSSPYTYAWTLANMDNGQHQWTARAYDAAGNVSTSVAVGVTVDIITQDTLLPATPSDLTAAAVYPSQIDLTWRDNSDNEDLFEIWRYHPSTGWVVVTVGPDAVSYSDYGLSPSSTYEYYIRARNSTGPSGWSNHVFAATQDSICGDGNLDPQEQCDDGNLVNGDGCENDCTLTSTTGYEELTPLTFNSKYIVQSDTPATTTSSTFVDDPEAAGTFTLNGAQTVLVLYQAHNKENTALGYWGIGHAISVDGVDHSKSYDTPSIPDQSARNQIFWIGTLGEGEHTVKGRFASPDNLSTVTISDRILLIYVFDGAGFRFIESSAVRTTSSGDLIDDNESIIKYFPAEDGKALYLYNISKESPSETEWIAGKKAAISVSSVDYSQAEKSTNGGNTMDSVFTLHAENVISHTLTAVKGRWASNVDTKPVRMDHSQIGVLFFSDSTLMDLIESDNQVSTTSNPLVDDAEATIQRTTSGDRELLLIAVATTREGTESDRKLNYGVSVDSLDREESCSTSDGVGAFANSAATSWGQTVYPGFHTLQGRFSSGGGTTHGGTYVDSRRIAAFWFTAFQGL